MTVQAIFLRDGAQWVRVPVQDILYLEADDNSTRVCGVQRSYTIGRMLKEVLVELSSDHMERIHRSYAVNIERVHASKGVKDWVAGAMAEHDFVAVDEPHRSQRE